MRIHQVAPGQWIRLELPKDTFPVHMTIGDETKPAFIEHERDRGQVVTYAKRRCPEWPAGRYPVRINLDDGLIETQIEIVR